MIESGGNTALRGTGRVEIMKIRIGRYDFEGPFASPLRLRPGAGVFAVMRSENGGFDLIDVGHAANIRSKVESHQRRPYWRSRANGAGLGFAALYTRQLQSITRQLIVDDIRDKYQLQSATTESPGIGVEPKARKE